jgi:hypothetical protein
LGRCRLLIEQCSHLWFFHVSGCYWTTCRVAVVPLVSYLMAHVFFAIGPRVVFSLDHVSCFYWCICPFLIRPHVTMLSVHVSFFNLATWLDDFLVRVGFLIAHVSYPGYLTCHALVRPRVIFLFDHVACACSTMCRTEQQMSFRPSSEFSTRRKNIKEPRAPELHDPSTLESCHLISL